MRNSKWEMRPCACLEWPLVKADPIRRLLESWEGPEGGVEDDRSLKTGGRQDSIVAVGKRWMLQWVKNKEWEAQNAF